MWWLLAFSTFLYRIAETFEGENFHKFCSFVAIRESFLCKIWGCGTFGAEKASNSQKFSPRKSYILPIRERFLPQKFPAIRYFPHTIKLVFQDKLL